MSPVSWAVLTKVIVIYAPWSLRGLVGLISLKIKLNTFLWCFIHCHGSIFVPIRFLVWLVAWLVVSLSMERTASFIVMGEDVLVPLVFCLSDITSSYLCAFVDYGSAIARGIIFLEGKKSN